MGEYKLREVFTTYFKAVKIIIEKYPVVFISHSINSIYSALIPYVYLYISALLINELTLKHIDIIWKLIFVTLSVTFILGVIGIVLKHWENYTYSVFTIDKEMILTNKMFEFKFKDMDSSYTYDLLSQIHTNEQFAGYGLAKIIQIFKNIIAAMTKIIGAVVLCWSFFTVQVTNESFSFLNSPVIAVAIIGIMILIAVVVPTISNRAKEYWASVACKAGVANRLFSFYGYLAHDQKRAFDIRIYGQHLLCEKAYQNFNAFRPGGEVANCAKGYMGILLSTSVAISYILTLVIYIYVIAKACAGAFGIDLITQYIGALTAMSGGISELLAVYGDMYTNTSFLKPIFEFLDISVSSDEGISLNNDDVRSFTIEFKNVYFKYPNSDDWVLKDISCRIEEGKHIAIVGENGSGKTTFVKLLCGLYEPDRGEILLNGVNIKKYQYDSYISFISVIFQDFNLLSQPIKNNIAASGVVDVSRAWKSAYKAGVGEFINGLPLKMDEFLFKDYSEDGINLSKGEEQKIAIARALYKDSRYIVLDEPTAVLDPLSERNIYIMLGEIAKSKTLIFVSHRLSSCIFCDDILVFEKGRIVQNNKSKILLKEEGKYCDLWNAQAQYYM